MSLSNDIAVAETGNDPRIRPDRAKANTTIYMGGLCCRDTTTGFVEPATDATGKQFCGIAENHITADGGTKNPKVILSQGNDKLLTCHDTLTQATLGLPVYVYDDGSVALDASAAHNVAVGYLVPPFVSATQGYVRIDTNAL